MITCPSCGSEIFETDRFCRHCGTNQNTLEEFLKRLVKQHNLTMNSRGNGWEITLPPRGEFICHLDIGPQALDVYATVLDRNDKHEIWMDWMDYTGYDDKAEDQLLDDKQRDIASFVRSWITAIEVRVSHESIRRSPKKQMTLEWNHSGAWDQVRICNPAR